MPKHENSWHFSTIITHHLSIWVSELLCETEINNVDLVTTLDDSHEEVVRL
jgi:hypothetical protein